MEQIARILRAIFKKEPHCHLGEGLTAAPCSWHHLTVQHAIQRMKKSSNSSHLAMPNSFRNFWGLFFGGGGGTSFLYCSPSPKDEQVTFTNPISLFCSDSIHSIGLLFRQGANHKPAEIIEHRRLDWTTLPLSEYFEISRVEKQNPHHDSNSLMTPPNRMGSNG